MPELPEAERARQALERALNREIVAVDDSDTYVCRPHAPGEIAAALTGRRLTAAHRRRARLSGGAEQGAPDRRRRRPARRALLSCRPPPAHRAPLPLYLAA